MSTITTLINNLSQSEAQTILHALVKNDPELTQRITELASQQLTGVDTEAVAAEVYAGLDALTREEVWDRAGDTRDGYVETGEAADEMIDEVITPWQAEITRYQTIGLQMEATLTCMAVLQGIHQFATESANPFKEWAGDSLPVYADEVVHTWRKGEPDEGDVAELCEFVLEELGGWVQV
ncbi:MAG: hypothetical protein KDE47_13440 [Caldilineaceae bacterium]|nr:hypothetical protein [Caldilineaceae bacterium]